MGDYEPVATPWRVVEYSMRPQSDGINMSDPGERWHICGHRLQDGTVMPCLGTYRLTLGSQPPPGLDESSPSDRGQGARTTRLGPLFSWHGFSEQAREYILAAVTLAEADDAAATAEHLRRVLQSPLPATGTADWVFTLFDELSLDLKTVLMRARQIGGDHIDPTTLAAALDRAKSGI